MCNIKPLEPGQIEMRCNIDGKHYALRMRDWWQHDFRDLELLANKAKRKIMDIHPEMARDTKDFQFKYCGWSDEKIAEYGTDVVKKGAKIRLEIKQESKKCLT